MLMIPILILILISSTKPDRTLHTTNHKESLNRTQTQPRTAQKTNPEKNSPRKSFSIDAG